MEKTHTPTTKTRTLIQMDRETRESPQVIALNMKKGKVTNQHTDYFQP